MGVMPFAFEITCPSSLVYFFWVFVLECVCVCSYCILAGVVFVAHFSRAWMSGMGACAPNLFPPHAIGCPSLLSLFTQRMPNVRLIVLRGQKGAPSVFGKHSVNTADFRASHLFFSLCVCFLSYMGKLCKAWRKPPNLLSKLKSLMRVKVRRGETDESFNRPWKMYLFFSASLI